MKCIDGHCYSVSCKGFLRVIKEAGVSVIQAIRTLVWSNIVEKVHKYVARALLQLPLSQSLSYFFV